MNKKNVLIFGCLFALLCTFILIGCLKTNEASLSEKSSSLKVLANTNDIYSAEFEIGNKTYKYDSELKSGRTTSTLKVFKGNSILYESAYELDTTISDYRLLQHKKVEELSKSLKFELQEKDYSIISSQVKSFFEAMFNNSSVRKRHVQSIFFHFAVINTKKRALLRNDGLYECLPHPGYILEKSYFWCQEDFFVKVALIKDVYLKHPDLMKDLKAKNLHDFIMSTNDEFLSYDKIYSFSVTKEKYLKSLDNIYIRNNSTNNTASLSAEIEAGDCAWWCPLGCGSDWGCCGNYSGCCFYRSIECYIHDRICTNCEPKWFCFSGCVPD